MPRSAPKPARMGSEEQAEQLPPVVGHGRQPALGLVEDQANLGARTGELQGHANGLVQPIGGGERLVVPATLKLAGRPQLAQAPDFQPKLGHGDPASVQIGEPGHVGGEQILPQVLAAGERSRPGPHHEDGLVRPGQDAKATENRLPPPIRALARALGEQFPQRRPHLEDLGTGQLDSGCEGVRIPWS